MTQQEIQDRNKEIAIMLGWSYVSSVDVKNGTYDSSVKAGWYSKIPKVIHIKINNHLYKGRGHNDLRFHSDWNRLIEAVEFILLDCMKKDDMESYHSIVDQIPDIKDTFTYVSDFAKTYN